MSVANGVIHGEGRDPVGSFNLDGSHDGKNLQFVKQYIGAHAIWYEGWFEANQQEMQGHWGFEKGDKRDKFELAYVQ